MRRSGARAERQRSIQIRIPPVQTTGRLNLAECIANSIRFPFNGFTYFLTLFSKFFSFFPQGTCLLPVSSSCLSLHETYHPLCTPFPKSVILKMHTVHEKHMMTNRNITLVAALFQEACIQAPIGNAFQHYMSRLKAPIIKMS